MKLPYTRLDYLFIHVSAVTLSTPSGSDFPLGLGQKYFTIPAAT